MNDTLERGSDFIRDLGDAARRNPVSAALLGMGVVWLIAGGKSAGRAGDLFEGLGRIPEAARDTLSGAGAGVKSATSSAAEAIRDTASEGLHAATRMGSEYAKALPAPAEMFGAARDNLADLFRAQPLALGAIGLAIGAGIAAALPHTEIEDSYLGEASKTVKSKTAEIAGQQIERATTLAYEVADTAAEEARKQGLTMEGAKAAAQSLSEKVGRVAGAATGSVSNGVR